MPIDLPVGWAPQQTLNAQSLGLNIPNYDAAMAGGYIPPDGSRTWEEYWTKQRASGAAVPLSLLNNGQFYDFPAGTNPSDVFIGMGDTASNYNAGIAPNSGVFASANPAEIADYRDAQRDSSWRGIGTVAALVGGAAALGATPWGSGAASGSGATTFPLAASGPITVSPLAGSIAPAAGGIGASMPSWVNWANLGSTVLGAIGADRAADAQVGASQAAIDESRRQYDTTRADFQPSINLLGQSAGQLSQLNSGDTSSFYTSPGYQFRLDEGTKAGERALSAAGMRQSGAAVKEAERYASGLASQEYGSFVDRLLASAGLGTTGAAASANAGANSAAQVGNASLAGGNARASGYANQYGALQGGLSNYMLSQYLGR